MCGLLSIENNLYYPAELIIVNGYLSIRKYTEDWRSHLLSFLLLSIIICCGGEKCEKDIIFSFYIHLCLLLWCLCWLVIRKEDFL